MYILWMRSRKELTAICIIGDILSFSKLISSCNHFVAFWVELPLEFILEINAISQRKHLLLNSTADATEINVCLLKDEAETVSLRVCW